MNTAKNRPKTILIDYESSIRIANYDAEQVAPSLPLKEIGNRGHIHRRARHSIPARGQSTSQHAIYFGGIEVLRNLLTRLQKSRDSRLHGCVYCQNEFFPLDAY